eukprot:gnl/TRDRNA2_/TRDRNA2_156940_c0_seq1.p1 gnl/TRDRNA2_/TRDRNA2_156940_c0~~gnl/TRDRNA2_/TRDRNA2_156940_c0_seq1.p1  ORF type:complete len:436 (+),score=66.23 gnl/TRDRNA2_/TRDRNA2_156940_c0_seq1:120-1310(+)
MSDNANLRMQMNIVAAQMESMFANPVVQNQAKLVEDEIHGLMGDPALRQQLKLFGDQMEAIAANLNFKEALGCIAPHMETMDAFADFEVQIRNITAQLEATMASSNLELQAQHIAEHMTRLHTALETSQASINKEDFADEAVKSLRRRAQERKLTHRNDLESTTHRKSFNGREARPRRLQSDNMPGPNYGQMQGGNVPGGGATASFRQAFANFGSTPAANRQYVNPSQGAQGAQSSRPRMLFFDRIAPLVGVRWSMLVLLVLLYGFRTYITEAYSFVSACLLLHVAARLWTFYYAMQLEKRRSILPTLDGVSLARKAPEFKLWSSSLRALLYAYVATYVSCFDLSKEWGIFLFAYSIVWMVQHWREFRHLWKYRDNRFSMDSGRRGAKDDLPWGFR